MKEKNRKLLFVDFKKSIIVFLLLLIASFAFVLLPSCSGGGGGGGGGGSGGGTGTGSGTGTGTGPGPGPGGTISPSPNRPANWADAAGKGLEWVRGNWSRNDAGYKRTVAAFCGLAMLAAGDDPTAGALKATADYVAKNISKKGADDNIFSHNTWHIAIGTWFLSEMVLHGANYSTALTSGMKTLDECQMSHGGYAHGPYALVNPIGYTDLEMISTFAILAMAGGLKAGASTSKLDSACKYVDDLTKSDGYITYDHRMISAPGAVNRVGGAMISVLYAGKNGSTKFDLWSTFFKAHFSEIPAGYSSAAIGYLCGAFGSAALGQEQWDKYVADYFSELISHQQADGFWETWDSSAPGGHNNFDHTTGISFVSGIMVLILHLDEGNLYTFSGK